MKENLKYSKIIIRLGKLCLVDCLPHFRPNAHCPKIQNLIEMILVHNIIKDISITAADR